MASKPSKSKSLQRSAARKPEGKSAKPEKGTKPAKPASAKAAPAPKASAKGAPKAKDGGKSKEAAKAKNGAPKDAAKPKDAPPKKKRKGSGVVRLKAFWGIFNQMLKRVAVFEYAERKAADKKAAELSSGGKQPHFVQLVKEVIRDTE